jgi:hypothetical protein
MIAGAGRTGPHTNATRVAKHAGRLRACKKHDIDGTGHTSLRFATALQRACRPAAFLFRVPDFDVRRPQPGAAAQPKPVLNLKETAS